MKWLLVSVVTLLSSITAFHSQAQQWSDFPDTSQLKGKEDYAKYESPWMKTNRMNIPGSI